MSNKTYVMTESQQSELEIALIEAAAVLKLLNNYLGSNFQEAEFEGLAETVSVVRSRLMHLWEAVSNQGFERRAELAAKGIESDLL